MNWEDVEAFRTVARLGSFTRAAEELRSARPAVSRRVARLERAVGRLLLHRGARTLTLTTEGQRLLDAVHDMTQIWDSARLELRAEAASSTGGAELPPHLRAAVFSATRHFVETMRRRHPRVEVLTEPFEALESMTALAQGELHLVVGFLPEGQVMRPDPAVRVRFLAREPIWVAVPASSPWARRRELDVAALRGAVWVAPPPGTLRTVFDQVAADAGFQPDVRHQTSDSTAIRALVATGQAVTLSAPTVPSSDDVTVLPLTGDAHRRLFTAWNPAVLDPAQARVLLQTVRSWYDDQVDAAPRYRRWLAARSGGVSRGRSA